MALFDNYETILFSRRGRILEVTLNRPHKLNTTDAVLHAELARVFVDISNDPDSDIVILTGAGRAFSAGGDVAWMQDAVDEPTRFEQTMREAKQIVFGLLDCEKPVIAKVNGAAAGLGCTIALFCDIIFAAEEAKIGDPHVSIGFVAGDGGAVIWPQLIGYARAKEYLFTGDMMTGKEAAAMGLINYAVPAEELDDKVNAFADKLAAGATKAIRWTKMSVNMGLRDLASKMLDASLAFEALSNMDPDHAEAVRAFAEKRPPVFGRSK